MTATPALMLSDDQRTLALAFYAAARAEIVQRLSMREQVLLASLTVSGVVAGFAFNGHHMQSLVLLGFFTVPFALAHVRHSQIIGSIDEYLGTELGPFLGQNEQFSVQPSRVRHWDCSVTLTRRIRSFLVREALMHVVLLLGPAVASLIYLHFEDQPQFAASVAAWMSTTFALLLLAGSFISAAKLRWPGGTTPTERRYRV